MSGPTLGFTPQEHAVLDEVLRDIGRLDGLATDWHSAMLAKMAEFKVNGDGTVSIPKPHRLQSL